MESGTHLFFSKKQFETAVHVAEVMIPQEGRLISPDQIVTRADALLSISNPPSGPQIRSALTLLEFVLPIVILRPIPFSLLSLKSRRKLLQKIVASHGQLRALARMLRTITAFCYYTDVNVRQAIGYVEFEQRSRYGGLDTRPYHYPPPRKEIDELR
jgi:hypothetical protein